ncbi:hypothetical protein J7T55_009378 [Diaporthe amygdali]|uniref:uncharacterized protein n=1 Tax=Phomopsis amygdali TaxID=1214568 RepID=UPI0022FE9728|nr:uncharacterized protein J7T55_009378 [Diaporthe amygdali]KAJ0107413.1 hypothetical protein J7T55_009378 [Diaporthe amygdali]
MACSLEGLTTPQGKHVSFDDIKAILASVDTGQPFKVRIDNRKTENDQKRVHLQIYSDSDITIDTNNPGSKRVEHINKPYDSRELVKQLQSLQLDDELVLKEVLNSSQPKVLSQLTAAHKNNSMIPLVTAKDGRVFLISARSLAYSEWAGEYPMEFSNDSVRKLSDPALATDSITPYRRAALMKIVAAVSRTEDSREFRKSVEALRPKIWNAYREVIAEPVDLSTIHYALFHSRYGTMADFRRHVDLLQQNAERFNGDRNKFITEAAVKVRMEIYRRMDGIPAEKTFDGRNGTKVRRIVYAEDDDDGVVADNDIEDDDIDDFIVSDGTVSTDGASGNEDGESFQEETPHEEASRSNSAPDGVGHSTLVLPLGRLCVARNAEDDEAIITPYIVVMEIETPLKVLWLVRDDYTPVGLPEDKKTLLDFGGRYNFTLGKLADDIGQWRVRDGPGSRAGRGVQTMQSPTLSWAHVQRSIRQSSETEPVIFDLVNTEKATTAMEKGWITLPECYDSGDSSYDGSESDHQRRRNGASGTSHGARKRRAQNNDHSDDDTYDERQPPRKVRTRSATGAAFHSAYAMRQY